MSNDSIQRPRGIRKVSELITQPGRALIITEENAAKYEWDKIPFGTIKVNEQTGIMSMKLKGALLAKDGHLLENARINAAGEVEHSDGRPYLKADKKTVYRREDVSYSSETNWVPAGIKNDGTLCIARDSVIVTEKFKITTPSTMVGGEEHCIYQNTDDKTRSIRKKDGHIVLELEKGEYVTKRNLVEVFIDTVLRRDAATGGIIELDSRHIVLMDDIQPGQEITVTYQQVSRIGNPYPRMFLNDNMPDVAEEGDFWLDKNYDDSLDPEPLEKVHHIDWSEVANTPTTIEGYGIRDNFSRIGHLHRWADIVDAPTSMKANGGNATTLNGYSVGNGPNNILKLDADGKIPSNKIVNTFIMDSGYFYVQTNEPTEPKQGTVWFDVTKNNECIRVFNDGGWVTFGSVWK